MRPASAAAVAGRRQLTVPAGAEGGCRAPCRTPTDHGGRSGDGRGGRLAGAATARAGRHARASPERWRSAVSPIAARRRQDGATAAAAASAPAHAPAPARAPERQWRAERPPPWPTPAGPADSPLSCRELCQHSYRRPCPGSAAGACTTGRRGSAGRALGAAPEASSSVRRRPVPAIAASGVRTAGNRLSRSVIADELGGRHGLQGEKPCRPAAARRSGSFPAVHSASNTPIRARATSAVGHHRGDLMV